MSTEDNMDRLSSSPFGQSSGNASPSRKGGSTAKGYAAVSTPDRTKNAPGAAADCSSRAPQLFSTPVRSVAGLPSPIAAGSINGNHMASDLTPITSNAGARMDSGFPAKEAGPLPGSYASLCTEEISEPGDSIGNIIDTADDGAGIIRSGNDRLLAPIKLRPDRTFSSFQGAGQYKRVLLHSDEDSSQHKNIESSTRRSNAPIYEQAPASHPKQYQPASRVQHGAKEMADAKDLEAIFKPPRNTFHRAPMREAPEVVSPHTPKSSASLECPEMADPEHQHLPRPYPMEDRQWSIPSIHLANHIDRGASAARAPSLDGELSEYADDDTASLDDSFLGDHDDVASSLETMRGKSIRIDMHAFVPSAVPSIVPPPLPYRIKRPDPEVLFERTSSDFAPRMLSNNSQGDSATVGSNGKCCVRRYRCERRNCVRGRREGCAAKWLAELRGRSSAAGTGGGEGAPISEAASSRFLAGEGGTWIACADTAGGGGVDGDPSSGAMGMKLSAPHTLCRSSTIEVG